MQWVDRAIILSVRRHGENSAIIRLLSAAHGLYAGVSRSALSRRDRGTCQPGNVVQARWHARLAEHMGSLQCELLVPIAAAVMQDKIKLAVLSSANALLEASLAEREPHHTLFGSYETLLLGMEKEQSYLAQYVRFELVLLAELGFGLDLSACVATGQKTELAYVSPKSAKAVSLAAGADFKAKLLPLPSFLLPANAAESKASAQQILDGMRLASYFLDKHIFAPHRKTLPAARLRLAALAAA